MPAATYSVIAPQVISLLNAQVTTTAYPVSTTDIGTSKRNAGEIKEAIVEADIEARIAICETLGNGFRNSFVSAVELVPISGNIQSAKLPERIGPVSRVEIRVNPADLQWTAGEQCPLSEIQEMLLNPDSVFQSMAHNTAGSWLGGYYYIDEAADLITWTGQDVRVYIASLGAVDRATPTLLTPDAYSPFLVSRALASLFKHGDSQSFTDYYARRADMMMMLIRQGARVLPQLEPLIREGAAA